MKIGYFVFIAMFCLRFAQAQNVADVRHPFQMTFQVVDDASQPIADVKVGVSTFHHWEPGEGFGRDISQQFSGVTNKDGLVTVRGESLRALVRFGAMLKEGYYAGEDGMLRFKEVKDGRWEPWNTSAKIVMKRVIAPTPMYARQIGAGVPLEVPAVNRPYGFDLMAADWVSPHGKGKVSDLIFTLKEIVKFSSSDQPFDYVLAVTFPKRGDGIQSVLEAPHSSGFRLPRYAPENGYEPEMSKRMARVAGQAAMINETREDQNYFFRVRTILDEQGRVKSALYGKISGDIAFGVNRVLRFTYYLNPTSLDRNMEFDPQRNLFEGVPSLEQVKAP
jgi:hypothetical protein